MIIYRPRMYRIYSGRCFFRNFKPRDREPRMPRNLPSFLSPASADLRSILPLPCSETLIRNLVHRNAIHFSARARARIFCWRPRVFPVSRRKRILLLVSSLSFDQRAHAADLHRSITSRLPRVVNISCCCWLRRMPPAQPDLPSLEFQNSSCNWNHFASNPI